MACLFCLNPSKKDIQQKSVTSEVDEEPQSPLTGQEKSGKNLEAFNCLCRLLKVNWRNNDDSEQQEILDETNLTFDIDQPLPLCYKCEKIYNTMYQLYQQFLELEVMIMNKVKVIRETIETTENEAGLKLGCSKLNEFRRMVIQSTINNQSKFSKTIKI